MQVQSTLPVFSHPNFHSVLDAVLNQEIAEFTASSPKPKPKLALKPAITKSRSRVSGLAMAASLAPNRLLRTGFAGTSEATWLIRLLCSTVY